MVIRTVWPRTRLRVVSFGGSLAANRDCSSQRLTGPGSRSIHTGVDRPTNLAPVNLRVD
jgi:hypothetical protein